MHGWFGWLACCFQIPKFACPYQMASVDIAPGEQEKKKESRHCWKGRVDSTGWQSWQTKTPSVFISVTFGRSAIALLHAKRGASPAEGRVEKRKRALMAKASGQALCLMSASTDTLDRREWEQGCGSCGKGIDKNEKKKKRRRRSTDWCNKSCQWRINTFMRQWDERKRIILVFDFQQWSNRCVQGLTHAEFKIFFLKILSLVCY